MTTRRARSGSRDNVGRRHVAVTMPRARKQDALAAAQLLEWSLGDWVLAAAAEHGPALVAALDGQDRTRRGQVDDAVVVGLYVTLEERAELDDQVSSCRVSRSGFVTAVAGLALGLALDEVLDELG